MPIEIRRFGVGRRRPTGPPGTIGVAAQLIHSDARGVVTELAFARGSRIEPHVNPNTTWLVVIEGGGWVGVGEERTRVAAGEAVLWPADLPHAAWTEHSEMRAIVIEFPGPDDVRMPGILAGQGSDVVDVVVPTAVGDAAPVHRLGTDGQPMRHDPEAGEPT